jgi:Uma2 family endonuclease
MATSALIPISEYLRGNYEPDAEYVDGRIEERAVGEREHSDLQRQLTLLLNQPEFGAFFVCNPEQRVQVSADRFRVPDLCVIDVDAPYDAIIVTPPMICIEILSRDDTMPRTLVKVRDYLKMGVPEVWVIDHVSRTVQVCVGDRMTERREGLLAILKTGFAIAVEDIFKVLRPAR